MTRWKKERFLTFTKPHTIIRSTTKTASRPLLNSNVPLALFYGLLMYFPKRRESIFNIYPLSLQYCLKREFNKYLVFLLMALHFFIVIVSYFAVTSLQLWQFYARKVHIKCKLFAPSRKAPPGFRIQIRPTRQNWIWILYIFYLIKM